MSEHSATQPASRRLLAIYLNDHLMGATTGVELARRSLRNNPRSTLGSFLEQLVRELEEDRATLEELVTGLGLRVDRLKVAAGFFAEKIGRLKLNGRLLQYSDLSRLEELEGLCAGVDLKLNLWRTLRYIQGVDSRIASLDLDALSDRARAQREGLEGHREAAVRQALT